ncbi:hemagglutinin repeat-containing protein, partial [Gilliamella sp. wkB108]|uniref:hemagglutinin repeat-containing protein n=1 Tax=Gilliamella sp. wkB108 TaxID=3120256 RepID=UPI00210012DD
MSRYKNLEDSTNQNNIRSELNSIKGNVSLTSGGDIHLVGTDITAGKSVDLTGKNVLMDVGEDSKYQKYISKNKQYGVTVSTSGYAVTAAQSLEKAARAIENHEDKRLSAIYAAQAALNLYSQSRQLANSSSQASQNVTQTADTNLQKTPVWKEKASSLVKGKVSLTADSSKQTHEYEQRLQSGTVIHAGENVNINAKENIEGKGVDIQGKNINLNAGQDIKFSAAQDMERVKNTDSGSHYGVGVGVNFGGSQNGFSLELSGSQSKGKENGNSENNTNSIIHARDKLNIHSGRDVILTGAELQGNRVVADIGRDLLISSLQDKEDYNSKHTSAGLNASICVPPFCAGSSQVSGSFSQDKMKSDYASVNEQSGIFAGEGGYDITVGNHTELTGAVIASEAEDKTRNRLETGTIGFSDIKNKAEYNVSSISVSGGA